MEKIEASSNHNIPVTELNVKEKGKIIKIDTDDLVKLRKLTAFGIMPGFDVTVIQKYPAIVLQIGFTQVALDEDIASEIIVSGVDMGLK